MSFDFPSGQGRHVAITLIAPDGTFYPVKATNTYLRNPYHVDLPDVDINGDWTLTLVPGNYDTLRAWTLNLKSGTSSLVSDVSGTGSEYAVTVDTLGSGTYGLGMAEITGITDGYYLLYDSLQTGSDETHDVGVIGEVPNPGDPLHVYSIERHDPQSVLSADYYPQFLVTFNKPVENVDVVDFASTYSTLSPIIRTVTTPLDVWYGESNITVPQRGTRPHQALTPLCSTMPRLLLPAT